jgi:hypothetical protein
MSIDTILLKPITGLRPFDELPIDAAKWEMAHGQHHLHRQLHSAVMHRPGVVYGLEVFPAKKERAVIIAPGVGIDSEGRTIVLRTPVSLTFEDKGRSFITIAFKETVTRESAITLESGGQEYYQLLEASEVILTKDLPTTPHLELARIYRTAAEKPVKEAANPFDPEPDELDLLGRRIAFPHCYASAAVGEISYVADTTGGDKNPWKANRAGLWNLVREGNGSGFHLDFVGLYPLSTAATAAVKPVLLYMAGKYGFKPLPDNDVQGLVGFLESGGTLVGEAIDGSAAFEQSFTALAQKLGARLAPVEKGHRLLTAHHVFSMPPVGAGAKPGKTLMDEILGVVFTSNNYGGAWQGELAQPDAPDARERIRQAPEVGLNIIAHAAQRRRRQELAKIG